MITQAHFCKNKWRCTDERAFTSNVSQKIPLKQTNPDNQASISCLCTLSLFSVLLSINKCLSVILFVCLLCLSVIRKNAWLLCPIYTLTLNLRYIPVQFYAYSNLIIPLPAKKCCYFMSQNACQPVSLSCIQLAYLFWLYLFWALTLLIFQIFGFFPVAWATNSAKDII